MDCYSGTARKLTFWFTIGSTLAVFSLLPLSKISFSLVETEDLGYFFAVFLMFSVYCWKRNLRRLAPALEAVAVGVFVTVPILVSTYLAASLDMPQADSWLIRADEAVGFDWAAFVSFVDSRPWLAEALGYAYRSFALQLLAIPFLLGAFGHYERIYRMILSYGVICYASSIISIWFPAVGTYAMYEMGQNQLSSIDTHYGFAFLTDFNAVRDQPAFALSMANASGIVTFPSVHAAGALLCIWAMWPVRPLRYLFTGWNILMAASAISHGSHYVVDIAAGLATATVAICAVTYVTGLLSRKAEKHDHLYPAGTGGETYPLPAE
ncbi:MAG: phosphatase PAP2 family protein [Mesorhizobium sp.]